MARTEGVVHEGGGLLLRASNWQSGHSSRLFGGGAGGKGTAENDLDIGGVSRQDIAGPTLKFQAELSLQRKQDNIKKRWVGVGE